MAEEEYQGNPPLHVLNMECRLSKVPKSVEAKIVKPVAKKTKRKTKRKTK